MANIIGIIIIMNINKSFKYYWYMAVLCHVCMMIYSVIILRFSGDISHNNMWYYISLLVFDSYTIIMLYLCYKGRTAYNYLILIYIMRLVVFGGIVGYSVYMANDNIQDDVMNVLFIYSSTSFIISFILSILHIYMYLYYDENEIINLLDNMELNRGYSTNMIR